MNITQVNDHVHVVTGTNVNWALVTDGDAVTVVDSGYPNDGVLLLESIEHVGRRIEDVQAILLTQAHLDHVGGILTLRARHLPVLTGTGHRHSRARPTVARAAAPIDRLDRRSCHRRPI